ncbi:hypothetical protein BJ912DRAFT_925747 [Pholiota molesta]|nr:hypothetical protein BJ912DRAFT_925747 [Pholiota molesta]
MYGQEHDSQWTTLVFIVGQALAAGLTIWRLVYRYWKSCLWWDDLASGIASLGNIAMFVHLSVSSQQLSYQTQSIAYWVIMDIKITTTWATRLSVLFGVGHIYKDSESSVDLLMTLLALYVIMTKHLKDPIQRKIMLISYSCTAWIFAINTAFTIAFLHEPVLSRTMMIWLANLMTIICVVICNLGFVAGSVYRVFFEDTARGDDFQLPADAFY